MTNTQVFNYIEEWLEAKIIKSYFTSKENGNTKYIKMKEQDFYNLCYKLVNLTKSNINIMEELK